MHTGDSIENLAMKAGLPADTLAYTVDSYNQAVRSRNLKSLDQPRTNLPIQAFPILRPPFYALPACAGISYTMGGLCIDAGCGVLDGREARIPGLYAVGATTGGLEGGPEVGYVGGLVQSAAHGMAVIDEILKELR